MLSILNGGVQHLQKGISMSLEFSESLKKSTDFKKVYNGRKSRADRYIVMYVLGNGTCRNRLGISVSKKVGNSVVRHRLTRLVREAYRLNEHLFQRGFDFVIVVRKMAPGIGYAQMEKSMIKLSKMHGVLLYGQNTDKSY